MFNSTPALSGFETEDHVQKPDPQSSGVQRSINREWLFETIICELQWTMVHRYIVTVLLGTASLVGAERRLRSWRTILNENGAALRLGLRYADDVGFDTRMAEQLRQDAAQEANLRSKLDAGHTKATYSKAMLTRAAEHNARDWQALCGQGHVILDSVASAVKQRLGEPYLANGILVARALSQAASSPGSCLDANGAITMPTLVQRRSSPRLATNLPCQVLAPGAEAVDARVLNVSLNGMCVRCPTKQRTGNRITVRLPDGRQIGAAVVWSINDRIGLSLDTALAPSDPLMRPAH